ncbi:L,D-transpeptidase family protein [Sphingomonas sp. CD22]|uniref:L,D-transpeptidase family protein n=1 Tax=Sphingomonas sp. CD22 TaxID=3100214 RepID=UPI002AE0AB32|nr:L,D-transpeptidase family protein [Sphingomonas sp. CD22]MEA1082833.1 L,D-transpeptidase family protein [Sphingomonas sp. CD22]
MAARRAFAAKLILAAVAIGVAAAATVPALRPAAAPPAHAPAVPAARAVVAAPRPQPRPIAQPTPNPLIVKRVLDIGPIKFGDYTWDDAGVPAGPLIVTVDLAAQTLSVFRDGYEIGATAILYGADDKPTPLGSFPILMKDAHHVSSLYGAPMPYTMRLTNDGVAVHGTEVAWGYATHGCIGVPTAFAKLLFREAKVGDRVIITRGKTLATGETLVS